MNASTAPHVVIGRKPAAIAELVEPLARASSDRAIVLPRSACRACGDAASRTRSHHLARRTSRRAVFGRLDESHTDRSIAVLRRTRRVVATKHHASATYIDAGDGRGDGRFLPRSVHSPCRIRAEGVLDRKFDSNGNSGPHSRYDGPVPYGGFLDESLSRTWIRATLRGPQRVT